MGATDERRSREQIAATTGIVRDVLGAAALAAHLAEEHRPVLVHARAAYLGEVAEDWRKLAPRLRPHVDHIVERIRTLAAEG